MWKLKQKSKQKDKAEDQLALEAMEQASSSDDLEIKIWENSEETSFSHRGQKSNDVNNFMMFLRFMSLLHILLGVYAWLYVLGIIYPQHSFFSDPLLMQGVTLFTATTAFVAAVGLWFLSPWGVSLWMLLAIVTISHTIFQHNLLFTTTVLLSFQLFFALVYVYLRRRYDQFIIEFGYQ